MLTAVRRSFYVRAAVMAKHVDSCALKKGLPDTLRSEVRCDCGTVARTPCWCRGCRWGDDAVLAEHNEDWERFRGRVREASVRC